MLTFEQLSSAIEEAVLTAYQAQSVLGLFQGVDIGDIGVENWFHKNLTDIPDAALSLAGFNPSDAKINADLFSHKVLTSAERLRIPEKDLQQFQKFGLDVEAIASLGAKVAEVASYYLWRGVGKTSGLSPSGDGNSISATGAGSLASPSIITAALTGVWGTYANKNADCFKIIGDLISAGGNLESIVVFYPKAAHASMHARAAAGEDSAYDMLMSQGILAVIPMDDQYLYTAAGAAPTNALFDLYAVDMSKVKIGYTKPETINVIAPHHEIRDTVAECEVWFVPYMVPVPKAGVISKMISRITAIAQA